MEAGPMITNDTTLLLLAGALAAASLLALAAGLAGPVAWEDEGTLRALAFAAGEATEWPPTIR
jgi:hypothetical protein